MLIWSTQIPIIPTRSTDDLIALGKKWLIGSPHSVWRSEDLCEAKSQEIVTCSKNGQIVAIAKYSDDSSDYCGFRYHWQDEARRDWTTDICGWKTGHSFLVGVQLHCQVLDLGAQLPHPNKPYIVRQLLEDLGGDLDGSLAVSDEPISLQESQVDFAIRILRGETDNYLPVIYASATWQNTPALDAVKLAQWASGMAHVVIEPSRRFSFIIANRVAHNNPYDGAVSICWPKGAGRQTRFFPYQFTNKVRFASAVADAVRQALAGRRTNARCTWDFIREQVSRSRIEALRKEGAKSIEEYVSEFDAEIAAKNEKLDQAEREIARLKYELARSNSSYRGQSDGLIKKGKERDLYSGEHLDILINALIEAKARVQPDGRVQTVLQSLIDANPPVGEATRLQQAIKDVLSNCTNVSTREQRELEDLGFSISEEGKHFKVLFRDDDRYTFSMAKTGSDWRGMRNWISDVTKRLFK